MRKGIYKYLMALLLVAMVIMPTVQALPCMGMAFDVHSAHGSFMDCCLVDGVLQSDGKADLQQPFFEGKVSHHSTLFGCGMVCAVTSGVFMTSGILVWNTNRFEAVLIPRDALLFSSQFYSPPVPPPWA